MPAGIEPGEVEDVVMGCAMEQGTMVMNMVRKGAIRTGLPVTVAGTTIDRQCASGLQAIAVAARSVMLDGIEVAVAGGAESINLVLNDHAEEQCLDPMRIERPLLAQSLQALALGFFRYK